jgi:hypothetical protein
LKKTLEAKRLSNPTFKRKLILRIFGNATKSKKEEVEKLQGKKFTKEFENHNKILDEKSINLQNRTRRI